MSMDPARFKRQRVLVTGGCGYVGTKLTQAKTHEKVGDGGRLAHGVDQHGVRDAHDDALNRVEGSYRSKRGEE